MKSKTPVNCNSIANRAAPAIEQRDLACEVKFLGADQGGISGRASVFGQQDSYGDVIKRGAFKQSLRQYKQAGRLPVMLWSHDVARPVGRWTEIREDETGLYVEGILLREIPDGDTAYKALKANILSGLSIGFRVVEASRDSNGIRTISQIDLAEISLVSLPAMPGARIEQVRSLRTAYGHSTSAMAAFADACRHASRALSHRGT